MYKNYYKAYLFFKLIYVFSFFFLVIISILSINNFYNMYQNNDLGGLIYHGVIVIANIYSLFFILCLGYLDVIIYQLDDIYSSQKRLYYHLEDNYLFFSKKSKLGDSRAIQTR